MALYVVLILALIQSLTEFLPISSTAHLALSRWLFGWTGPGHGAVSDLTFDIALHLGTLAATVIYFFRDWLQLAAQAFGIDYKPDPELAANRSLFWMLAIGTVPAAIAGLALEKYAETVLRGPLVIAAMMIVVGAIMWVADRRVLLKKGISTVSWTDALLIGCAQAVAIVPGVSRSGATITAALFRDLRRETAARFSFLLATPALTGAAVLAAHDLYKAGGLPHDLAVDFVLGTVVSGIAGWLVIAWFLRYLRTRTLRFFVYYRIVFGIIIIALALFVRRAG